MNTDLELEHLLAPLDGIDPGTPPPITARPSYRRHGAALAAISTCAAAALVIGPMTRGDSGSLSLGDVLGGARVANAAPGDAASRVHYSSTLVDSDFTLLCAGATVLGDPSSQRVDVAVERWVHAESGRDRTHIVEGTSSYDFTTTITGYEADGTAIADFAGSLPEPAGDRGCDRGVVSAVDRPLSANDPTGQDVIETLLTDMTTEHLDPNGSTAIREQVFATLAALPAAVLDESAGTDQRGRAVIAVHVELSTDDQRFSGTWRFDPESYVLREVAIEHSTAMFDSSTVTTIIDEAWLTLDDAIFDLNLAAPVD